MAKIFNQCNMRRILIYCLVAGLLLTAAEAVKDKGGGGEKSPRASSARARSVISSSTSNSAISLPSSRRRNPPPVDRPSVKDNRRQGKSKLTILVTRVQKKRVGIGLMTVSFPASIFCCNVHRSSLRNEIQCGIRSHEAGQSSMKNLLTLFFTTSDFV